MTSESSPRTGVSFSKISTSRSSSFLFLSLSADAKRFTSAIDSGTRIDDNGAMISLSFAVSCAGSDIGGRVVVTKKGVPTSVPGSCAGKLCRELCRGKLKLFRVTIHFGD